MSKRKPARTIKARSASKIRSKAAGSGQPKGRANSKQARVLALLCGPSGATIATVTRSTGWQPHTVRAFLAAVVRKKLERVLSLILRPLGRPASPNPVPQNFLHGRSLSFYYRIYYRESVVVCPSKSVVRAEAIERLNHAD
jgi:Protein of unknown function (DUF3489)